MTRPPITEQLVAEAKQARDQFLAEVQALVDEHGPRVLGRVMIEVAMHPVPGMASFLNYFLLRNFMTCCRRSSVLSTKPSWSSSARPLPSSWTQWKWVSCPVRVCCTKIRNLSTV